ncbi:hypothetical protein LH128_02444 [Sphingomonas sp. LH128]|uniref:hypothetical protein n=1 Tax=Sphingomonas sp. LH128 TaxID=473781 RepID=UPI00027CA2E3|nr:hypothetical protein [Sphingomonas sp. LH128]EJU14689.1 hypothetical protein LH128_02444 [Sphingomonas sp. LH128]
MKLKKAIAAMFAFSVLISPLTAQASTAAPIASGKIAQTSVGWHTIVFHGKQRHYIVTTQFGVVGSVAVGCNLIMAAQGDTSLER